MSYTIKRTGQFYANLDPCDQCGGAGQKTFRFEAEVTVQELDVHGFALDNRDVPEAFNGWEAGEWIGTCEDLAVGGLLKLWTAGGGRATRIQVRIIANGDSHIEAVWEQGERLPQRKPRKKQILKPLTLREEGLLL